MRASLCLLVAALALTASIAAGGAAEDCKDGACDKAATAITTAQDAQSSAEAALIITGADKLTAQLAVAAAQADADAAKAAVKAASEDEKPAAKADLKAKNAILASAVKTLATAKKADKKATDAVTKAIAAVAKAQTASVKLHKKCDKDGDQVCAPDDCDDKDSGVQDCIIA